MSMSLDWRLRYHSVSVDVQEPENAALSAADEDIALVARAQTGDTGAFEELVRRYRNEVYALSYHFLRNREEAWDVSQEAFIKAYRSLKSFRGEAGFKTWLMRITANHCKDFIKKRKLSTAPLETALPGEAPSGMADPSDRLAAKELGEAIESAVAGLPEKHRAAFVLREYQGLSYQEMSEVMECSLGTVMSRLHHARKKLQNALVQMGVAGDS